MIFWKVLMNEAINASLGSSVGVATTHVSSSEGADGFPPESSGSRACKHFSK